MPEDGGSAAPPSTVNDGDSETFEGYVMDVACIRKAPASELVDRASAHPTSCGLMGHCVESGFGLVDDDGRIHLLEPAATTAVVEHLLDTTFEEGLRLVVRRERAGEEMRTVDVVRGDPSFGAVGHHIRP